jgi:hypothetical protein
MAKFTDQDYLEGKKQGLSQKQMALQAGVSEARVSNVKKRCEGLVSQNAPQYIEAEVLERQRDALTRLESLARRANELTELYEAALGGSGEAKSKLVRLAGYKADLLKSYVAVLGENRKMIELDNTIKKTKFDMEAVLDLQRIMIEEVRAEAPECAQRIVQRFVALNAARSNLDFGQNQYEKTL